MSSKKLLGPTPYLMICKCQFTIWICCLAVEISGAPCTGEVVSLFAKKTGNCFNLFWNASVQKRFDNVNLSGRTLTSHCL